VSLKNIISCTGLRKNQTMGDRGGEWCVTRLHEVLSMAYFTTPF